MRPHYELSEYGALDGEIIGMRSSSGAKQIFTFYKEHSHSGNMNGAQSS